MFQPPNLRATAHSRRPLHGWLSATGEVAGLAVHVQRAHGVLEEQREVLRARDLPTRGDRLSKREHFETFRDTVQTRG